MIDRKWQGQCTDPFDIYVTREWIQEYSALIGEDNPLFHDPSYAKEKGYADVIAPLTFPIVFWQYAKVVWLENQPPVIHREQSFFYHDPIMANRIYRCQIILNKLTVKKGMHYLEHTLVGYPISSQEKKPTFRAMSLLVLK